MLIAHRYNDKEFLVRFDGDKQAVWVFLASKGCFQGLFQAGQDAGVDGLPNLRGGITLGGRDSEQCPTCIYKKHISCADGPYLEQHVTDTKRFQVRSLECPGRQRAISHSERQRNEVRIYVGLRQKIAPQ